MRTVCEFACVFVYLFHKATKYSFYWQSEVISFWPPVLTTSKACWRVKRLALRSGLELGFRCQTFEGTKRRCCSIPLNVNTVLHAH